MTAIVKDLGEFSIGSVRHHYLLFPPAGGSPATVQALADACPEGHLLAVEYPGRADRLNAPPARSFAELVTELTDAVLDVLGTIDLSATTFVGFSMGAELALEVAQNIEAAIGQPPAALVVVGSPAPQLRSSQPNVEHTDAQLTGFLRQEGAMFPAVADQQVLDYAIALLRADLQLVEAHVPSNPTPVSCPIIALCGADDHWVVASDATDAWSSWTSESCIAKTVPGGHLAFLDSTLAPSFWQQLTELIERNDSLPLELELRWHEFFQRRVKEKPHHVALVVGKDQWTFSELDELSDALATRLLDHGVHPGDRVACALTRSAQAVVALLAVAKADCVYLPVNPTLPEQRLAWLLTDAQPSMVLTDIPDLVGSKQHNLLTLYSATWESELRSGASNSELPVIDREKDAPAYIVYTSGSTGQPKGVVVGHCSLINLYHQIETEFFPLAAENSDPVRVTHGFPLFFDAAWDPLLWMVGGHELHLLPNEIRMDASRYVRYVQENNITVVEGVPTLVGGLVNAGLLESTQSLRLVLLGGENISQTLWSTLASAPEITAINLYGPTECTVFATSAPVTKNTSTIIGHPIRNVTYRVVDDMGNSVPVGSKGELLLGGACLALEYLNRPDLTAERFVTYSGSRWYRTGDLCRPLSDGSLEFLGRLDEQVKIRGYRVEPAEVEHSLQRQPNVRQGAVVAIEQEESQYLAAYVVLKQAVDPNEQITLLRKALAAELPDYLVPSTIQIVDAFEVNANGKIDRAALRALSTIQSDQHITPPQTPAERLVAQVWCSIFGTQTVDVHADFFASGGNSLLAAQLAAGLRDVGVRCSLLDVFRLTTVFELSALVPKESGEGL